MENKKVLTSFSVFAAPEGMRISYTFSEVSPDGELISSNEKRNCILLGGVHDDEIEYIQKINEFLEAKLT